MCDPKVINSSLDNIFNGETVSDANDADFGITSINEYGLNNPYAFWATLITTHGHSITSYKQQFAMPWGVGVSNNMAYRVLDNNVWGNWQFIPDKNLYNNQIFYLTPLSTIVATNGPQCCYIIGNVCYIHLNFWYTQDPNHTPNTAYNFAQLPSEYSLVFSENIASTMIGDTATHAFGRVCTLGCNGTYLTISSPSGIFKNDHIQFDFIARAVKN